MSADVPEDLKEYVYIVWSHNDYDYSLFGSNKRFIAVYATDDAARLVLKSGQFYTQEQVL